MLKNKFISIIFCFILFNSCEEESKISFVEVKITTENNDSVEINIPEAIGDMTIAEVINSEINHTVMSALHIGDSENITSKSVEESIDTFNKEYKNFMNEFPDSAQVWNAEIDGEVIYQSDEIISVSISSYVNTGGAHGIFHISFLNFSAETGKRIPNGNLFNDITAFKNMAKTYFDTSIKDKSTLFEKDNFTLPVNIGYTEDGLILAYNVYEIAPYSTGLIDFTIPYEEADDYLVFKGSR
ncbi:DUF3298 and DUF4163 domain-containing protein [Gaetbulibacter aquiaggeris]|uniref:DUF3298 and DUF4163 domain-containing protein n=1 Tax=Gaetbulibacter aquiaggeris TaxID=1735373 RepID=A0ABW7MLK9_9FLAO